MSLLWKTRLLFVNATRSLCSSVIPGFTQLGASNEVCQRLSTLYDISTPTLVQEKCLPLAFSGRHVVVNAETGSGKTLCFLLPILERLLQASNSDHHGSVVSPFALVMVPTSDLAHQIHFTFQKLSLEQFDSSVSYSSNRLLLKPTTRLVIATPTSLCHYDLERLLKDTQIICYDEADILFVGGQQKESWNILKTITKLSYKDKKSRQLLLTAATLPGKSPKSVGTLLRKQLPRDTVFVNTKATHQIVPSAGVTFINFEERSKLKQLLYQLENCKKKEEKSSRKILIFCNTAPSVTSLYEELTKRSGKNLENSAKNISDSVNTPFSIEDPITNTSENFTENFTENSVKHQASHAISSSEHLKSDFSKDSTIKEDTNSSSSNAWWTANDISHLHKGIPPLERAAIIEKYNSGQLSILITTDISSRGLDLPDISHVIMYDFPTSTVDFIHRAGRTARAGKKGKVIAFVDSNNNDLANAIEGVLLNREEGKEERKEGNEEREEGEVNDLSHLFSRNKMLRRKFKRQSLRNNRQSL